MNKMYSRMDDVTICWKGTRTSKEGKVKDIVQGETRSETGFKTLFVFGGIPDVVKTIEVGEVLSLEVAVKAFQDNLYTDIMKVDRSKNMDKKYHVEKDVMKKAA